MQKYYTDIVKFLYGEKDFTKNIKNIKKAFTSKSSYSIGTDNEYTLRTDDFVNIYKLDDAKYFIVLAILDALTFNDCTHAKRSTKVSVSMPNNKNRNMTHISIGKVLDTGLITNANKSVYIEGCNRVIYIKDDQVVRVQGGE